MRETWIDQARGLCMLMVLWFHAEMYSGMGQTYSILITPFFMQAFFFLSGYLFVRNRQRFSFIDKMKRCVIGIWIPYIIFTTIMLVPKIYLHHWSISHGLMTILTGQASWFVYVLGLMQILVGGVIALTQRLGKAWYPPLCLMIIAGGALGTLDYVYSIPIWASSLTAMSRMLPFYVWGILFRERIIARTDGDSFKNVNFILTVFVYLLLLSVDQFLLPYDRNGIIYGCKSYVSYMLLGVVGIYMLIVASKSFLPRWKWLDFIGMNTIIFYFLNGFVYTIIRKLLAKTYTPPNILLIPIMLLTAILTLSLLAFIIRRYCPLMIGDKNAWNRLAEHFTKFVAPK